MIKLLTILSEIKNISSKNKLKIALFKVEGGEKYYAIHNREKDINGWPLFTNARDNWILEFMEGYTSKVEEALKKMNIPYKKFHELPGMLEIPKSFIEIIPTPQKDSLDEIRNVSSTKNRNRLKVRRDGFFSNHYIITQEYWAVNYVGLNKKDNNFVMNDLEKYNSIRAALFQVLQEKDIPYHYNSEEQNGLLSIPEKYIEILD